MPSSRFSYRPVADPPIRSSPNKSRLKTFSAFLFSSTAHQSPSPPRHHAVPSAPMPYHPPTADIPISSGSPLRVIIREGLPEDPLHQSPGGDIAGLPSKWKDMPTLASAIHIADVNGPTNSFHFGPTQPLPKTAEESKLPRSASNSSSIFKTYGRGRSASRSFTSKIEVGQRRMSRRLSFDNILPLFNPSSRRKDRVVSLDEPPLADRRWSATQSTEVPVRISSLADVPPIKANRMALPAIRTLRSRFAVGGAEDKGGLRAIAKADLAARQVTRDKEGKGKEAGTINSFQSASLGSAAGGGLGGALRRMGEDEREGILAKWHLGQLSESAHFFPAYR